MRTSDLYRQLKPFIMRDMGSLAGNAVSGFVGGDAYDGIYANVNDAENITGPWRFSILGVKRADDLVRFWLDVPAAASYMKISTGNAAGDTPLLALSVADGLELWDATPTIKVHIDPAGDSYFNGGDVRIENGDLSVGTTVSDERLVVKGNAKIYQLDHASSLGSQLVFQGLYTTPADGQSIANIRFQGYDDAAVVKVYGEIYVASEDVTAGTIDGTFLLSLQAASVGQWPVIAAGNDVLIGAGTNPALRPGYRLDVRGTARARSTSTYQLLLDYNDGNTAAFQVDNAGNLTIDLATTGSYNTVTYRTYSEAKSADTTSLVITKAVGTADNDCLLAHILTSDNAVTVVPAVATSSSNIADSAGTITLTVPSGTTNGDLLIAVLTTRLNSAHTHTTPSGWTVTKSTASGNYRGTVYQRIASSEPADYAFANSGSTCRICGEMYRITGHDPTTPVNIVASAWSAGTSTSVDAASVTTSVDNCLLFWVGFVMANINLDTVSGMTELHDLTAGATAHNSTAVDDQTFATAGATGTKSVTIASADWMAIQFAIAPAPVTLTPPTITPPGGWTLVRSDTKDGTRSSLYSKIAASEGANWTFSISPSSPTIGEVVVYYNVDTTTPVEANNGQTNASSTSVTAPSVTTLTDGAHLVFFGSADFATPTFTPPASFTERVDSSQTQIALTVADLVQASAGASGSKTATASGAVESIGQLIALRPSSSAAIPALKIPDYVRLGSGLYVGSVSGGDAADNWIYADGGLALADGITAPSTVAGKAQIYVDTADGDLKVKFGDGTVKTIVTDT